MLPTKIFFSIPPGKHIIQLYSSKFSVPWHQKSLKKSEILPNHCPDFLRISAFLQRENKTSYIRSVFIEDHGRRYSLCFPYYKPILSYLTEYNLHHFPFCPKWNKTLKAVIWHGPRPPWFSSKCQPNTTSLRSL
jgi:hypothetical protein